MPYYHPDYGNELDEWAAKILERVPRGVLPPGGVAETAQKLQPYIDTLLATIDQVAANSTAGISDFDHGHLTDLSAFLTRVPVPTTQELRETEQALRERVLPEVSEEELQQAVEEIPDDPEKAKLAAFLLNVLQRAASVSPAPYALFVVVYWIAVRMNAPEVAAAGLAFFVMQDYRNRHGD